MLYEDAVDCMRLPKLKTELRRGGVGVRVLMKETVEWGRGEGRPGEGGAGVLVAGLENGRVMVPFSE